MLLAHEMTAQGRFIYAVHREAHRKTDRAGEHKAGKLEKCTLSGDLSFMLVLRILCLMGVLADGVHSLCVYFGQSRSILSIANIAHWLTCTSHMCAIEFLRLWTVFEPIKNSTSGPDSPTKHKKREFSWVKRMYAVYSITLIERACSEY
jgi:hypothetical protein